MEQLCNRVVQVGRFGGPDGLEVVAAALPTAGRGEVRVRVQRGGHSEPMRVLHRRRHARRGCRLVLEDVSFDVPPGVCVGIVGPTGAGKTTLLGLLPRFYDPGEGAILLDQVDLRDYRLVSTSISENIAYGRPGANEAQIIAAAAAEAQIIAAAAAGAHKFISRPPRGYHRPSALGVCDMVLEVKDGRLVSPTSQEGAMR